MLKPKIKLIKMYVVIAAALASTSEANASVGGGHDVSGNPILTSQSTIHNSIYAALKWTFGESFKPEVILGLRHAKVDSNGDTYGGDISLSTKFMDGLELGKLRGKYFNGNEDVQGEIGAGFDFTKGFYTGISVHGPYSNLGVDYCFSDKNILEPYIQIDTIKGNNKPSYITTIEPVFSDVFK